jgi:hypothetical protein
LKKSLTIVVASIAVFALTGLFLAGFGSSGSEGIVKVKSGLIAQDSLDNGRLTFTSSALGVKKPIISTGNFGVPQWVYYGSAVPRNSTVSVYEDAIGGLHMGIKATNPNSWTGFFAMSNDDYSNVYHTVINMPYRSTSEGSFSTGLYVQTSVIYPYINYVACVAAVERDGVRWVVESGTGNATEVTDRHQLWADNNPSLPLKRDCMIVTDGDSKLKVYYDHKLVYSANNLNLQMPKPFNSYMEVQTTNSKDLLYGMFSDYYSTLDEDVKVINAPIGGSVVLIGSDNKSVITTPTINGVGSLKITDFNSPFKGSILIYDRSGALYTRTNGPIYLSGGDIYSAVSIFPIQKWLLNQ